MPDASTEHGPDSDEPAEVRDGGGNTPSPETKKDAEGEPSQTTNATFTISGASFTNKKGVSGDYFYTITFTLKNTASDDLTALELLTYDFGSGKKISLTEPACDGKLSLKAGKTTTIETQIGVGATGGALANYSNFCSPTQYFGGATGSAPATDAFDGPIAITIGGTTSKGTFTGSGSAERK